MTDESGLTRVGGVVVLSGPALRLVLRCVLVVIKLGKMSGASHQTYKALACELNEAMAADARSDVRSSTVRDPVPVDEPTVPIAEAAAQLGISDRQARRLAPQLGGRMIAGRWLVDELALRQHIEGRQA